MNVSSFIGLVAAGLTLWFGVFRAAPNKMMFLDSHAIILVIGGTVAAAFMAFPYKRLARLGRFFLTGFLYKSVLKQEELFEELIRVAESHDPAFPIAQQSELHPFLSDALVLLARPDLGGEEVRTLLSRRIETIRNAYRADAKMLNALGKFPPAFGLLGASAGMIAMMMNLGNGGAEAIGPAMAIALVATFWGIAVANLVILPLADFAGKMAQEEVETRFLIMDVIVQLKQGETSAFVQEFIRSSMTPTLRASFRMRRESGEKPRASDRVA